MLGGFLPMVGLRRLKGAFMARHEIGDVSRFGCISHFSVFSEKVESGFIYQKQAEIHAGQMGWASNLSAWASKTFTTLDK